MDQLKNQSHSQLAPGIRQPVDGDPDLTDLVHPGDYIRSSCNTEGLVVGVHRYQYHVSDQIVAAYSIRYWSKKKLWYLAISDHVRLDDYSVYREVVVHQGKLCKLFEAGEDIFEVVPIPEDVTVSARAWAFVYKQLESGQMQMF